MPMATAVPGKVPVAFETRPYIRAMLWLALLTPFFFLSYGFANWVTSLRANVPAFAFGWESSIPFLAWTIVPYWSTDLLYAASIFICRTRRELDTHASRLLAAQVVSVSAFLLFPLRFSFERPATHGLFGLMFDALGSFDKPFNQAPSLHLSLTTILWARFSAHLTGVPLWLVRGWLALAALATLTTYQHHFIDLPTGVLVGLICIGLFPNPPDMRRTLAAAYLLACLFLGTLAAAKLGPLGVILFWPAAAIFIVATAYGTGRPDLLGKSGRGMHPVMAALLAPFIVVAWLNSRWWTRRQPPAQEIARGVWIGRSPNRSQIASHRIVSIVDLTAELAFFSSGIPYRSVPMLDLIVPSVEQLDAAVVAIDAFETARPTLVCCALGYSRSAAAMAAWLVASGNAASVNAAIEMIRERRPRIVLGRAHEARLKEWACRMR
jgi:protein-tyrosine phosphatase